MKGGATITIQLKPFDWEENPYYEKYVRDAQVRNPKSLNYCLAVVKLQYQVVNVCECRRL